jgi:hypothetical protein
MNAVPFRYGSFSVEDYRSLLRENDFTLLDTHAGAGGNGDDVGAEGDVKHAVTTSHKKRISTMFCLTS